MTDATRNQNVPAAEIANMFRENKPGDVPGYISGEGAALGLGGDKDAPFIKEPPFVTDTNAMCNRFTPMLAGAGGAQYDALPEIQCKAWRLIQLYFVYQMALGGRLSIIPEVKTNGLWFVESLVGPTVSAFTPVGTRFAYSGFGSRALEFTELRTDAMSAGTARFTVAFDVTAIEAFRLNVLELTANAGNLLDIGYALSV